MIFVIGGTGKVGRETVSGLLERGIQLRALVRDPGKAVLPSTVEVVVGDLSVPESFVHKLDGAEAVFLLWPFMTAARADEIVGALAQRAKRIVYLSAEAAGRRPESFWSDVERAIERAAAEWAFLRPTGFAANTLIWADQIRDSAAVRWVYGRAARSPIDERDIANVAVRALSERSHIGSRYVLTGPESLTQEEQVQQIGQAIGRGLRWEEIGREEIQGQLTGVPESALDTWASFVRSPEVVTPTVKEVTGRPPRTFGEWARDHADRFR